MRVIRIGYWAGEEDRWPDVNDFIDPTWDSDERMEIILYLRQGLVARAYLGQSRCRICGKINGSVELTDYVYIWPEGLAHYLTEHDVRLPAEFVEHVRSQSDVMDDLEVDEHWWLSQRR